MKNESVAILDIRSYELTFLIGGKGVNDTFVFRGSESDVYDGYSAGGFFDVDSFSSTATHILNKVLSSYDGTIHKLYLSVPAPFLTVYTKGQTLSFPKRKKITQTEIDTLFSVGLNGLNSQGKYIGNSAMYFTVGDNCKYFSLQDILSIKTSLLQGALCYYFIDESFYATTKKLCSAMGFNEVEYIPQTLAMATYLLPPKTREGYAVLLDIGDTASVLSVVYGGGIVHQEAFSCGVNKIAVALMNEFAIEFEKSLELLAAADIAGGIVKKDLFWTDRDGNAYPVQRINDIIKSVLDELCECADTFFEKYYGNKKIAGDSTNPLYLTGEGIEAVRGVSEHISRRLNKITQVIYPEIPYFDKPIYSSRISVLHTALDRAERQSGMRQLFKIFGGTKK